MEKVFFLLILIGVIYLYISQRVPIIITALLTVAALALWGIIPMEAALSGFSNTATITIGAMFVLSAGLIRTGALDAIAERMVAWIRGSRLRALLCLGATVPLASAFVNNTPVVIMMVPVVLAMSRNLSISPSKLLIPLSYFSIFGGSCTLIGTSTNLLVEELYRLETQNHLGIFDFSPLGIVLLIIATIFLILFSDKLLPKRETLSALLPVSRRTSYVTEVIVPENSPLIGQAFNEWVKKSRHVRLLQLLRDGEEHYYSYQAEKTPVQAGDVLILEATPQELNNLLLASTVTLGTVVEDEVRVPMRTISLMMVEVIILPVSSYIGTRISDLKLFRRFGVKVLAVQRGGHHHRIDLRRMRLKAGDILLVQGEPEGLTRLQETGEALVIEDIHKSMRHTHKAKLAAMIMAAVILMTLVTPIPLVVWAILGSIVMILTHCLRTEEAIGALDFNVLFLLIGTIPLGAAMVQVGIIEDLSNLMAQSFGGNPYLLVSVLFLVTNILTAILSNNAVAVLMTPLAISLAMNNGVNPEPFVMAVAFAANTSLATPQGYQTNIIVMGPGGYQFSDFLKIGLPLNLVVWIVASLLIPVFFPF